MNINDFVGAPQCANFIVLKLTHFVMLSHDNRLVLKFSAEGTLLVLNSIGPQTLKIFIWGRGGGGVLFTLSYDFKKF